MSMLFIHWDQVLLHVSDSNEAQLLPLFSRQVKTELFTSLKFQFLPGLYI